jgi:glutamate-1-semialdehyde aminotransferase
MYISAAHTEADIDKTLEVMEKVLKEMMKEEKII